MIINFVDYMLARVIHFTITIIVAAILPLFTIYVRDPVLESGMSQSYQMQCGAFYSRALDRNGHTVCTSTNWAKSCWDIVKVWTIYPMIY